MNFYQRHLGDYAKDTRHLTMVEHGAYNLLLDYYYATEKPIPDDRCERIANAHADAERQAVRQMLKEFFVETPEGWRHAKCDRVIEASKAKSLKAKESAGARWQKAQSDNNANASETHSERNASHKPLTNNQEKGSPSGKPASRAVEIDTWLDSLPEGVDPIPANDPIIGYAEQTRIPVEYLELAWDMFAAAYRDKHKRQKDWPGTFRNAVKGNWYKLWYFTTDGECKLTTAGEQAKRAAA